ncbi:MAG: MBL fold metallo-hydrolase [bacterium]|nr:MBL fold metallo-hydrolase [bacterium]
MSRAVRILVICTLVAVAPMASFAAGTLTITVLDVGQADATLIQSPSGRTLLFDGGDNGDGVDVVLPFLAAAGIDTLDWIVASHYHADHIGGLDEVLNRVPVHEAVLDRGWSYTTATYTSYAAAAAPWRQTLIAGQVLDLGDGVTVTCLALNGNGQLASPYNSSSKENEYDICLKVEYGGFDYFQAGDLIGNSSAGTDIETSVAPLAGDLDVYHVNHHGSYTSSNAVFLATTQPEVSIISVGNNGYGHPHQSVLDRLVTHGSFVYQTETGNGGTLPAVDLTVVGGHVVIATDGLLSYTVDGDAWEIDDPVSAAGDTPSPLALRGNAPNPFNPLTRIAFASASAGPGRLMITDLAGRRVLVRALDVATGENSTSWAGRDGTGRPLAGGVYLYTVVVPGGTATGRMVLLK